MIASAIAQQLHKLGEQGRAIREALFDLTKTVGNMRRPDVAFVSYRRWPRATLVPRTEAWDVVLDLAVEVVSPTNSADEVMEKVADYFHAGVERVWVVYPSHRQIYIYSSS